MALAVAAFGRAAPEMLAASMPPGALLDVARWHRTATAGGALATAAAAVFALVLFAPAAARWRVAARTAAALSLFAPLAWAAWTVTATAPRAVVSDVPSLLAPIVAAGSGAEPRPRVFVSPWLGGVDASSRDLLARSIRETAAGNAPSRFGLAVLPGADSVRSEGMTRLLGLERFVPIERLAGMLSARHLVLEWNRIERGRILRSDPRMQASLVELPEQLVRPRAFVAPAWRWVDDQTALRELVYPMDSTPALRPWIDLVGSGEVPAESSEAAAATPCAVAQPSPEEVDLECVAPRGGYAVLLDEDAPGWSAEVDGRAAPIERADGLFRAVRVAPGIRHVRFTYRTPGLRLGAMVSIASWAALLGVVAWLFRARRRGAPPPGPAA
jgi:hypothetical protein